MPGPAPTPTLVYNYAMINDAGTKREVGLGIAYDSSTNEVTISGVDTSQPICIGYYLNTNGNGYVYCRFTSGLTTISYLDDDYSSEGVRGGTMIGTPTSSNIVQKFSGALGTSRDFVVVAYQVTLQ